VGVDQPAQPILVLTTLPTAEAARGFVRQLVDKRLVACGTVLTGATSIYRWEGEVAETPEAQVILKTQSTRWNDLQAAVADHHPYDVPELLALPVASGLEAYLDWVASETTAPEG
jgi:periplasmic divalent cation tolerance protein